MSKRDILRLKPRKGYWSADDFAAPRIGRETSVATDMEIIEECRRRFRDPGFVELFRLVAASALAQPTPEGGLIATVTKPPTKDA